MITYYVIITNSGYTGYRMCCGYSCNPEVIKFFIKSRNIKSVNTEDSDYFILDIKCENEKDLYSKVKDIVNLDDQDELTLLTSYDNKVTVLTSGHIELNLSEMEVYSTIQNEFGSTIIILETLINFIKDDNYREVLDKFISMLKYKYFVLVTILDGCDTHDMTYMQENYPQLDCVHDILDQAKIIYWNGIE